MKFDLIQRGHFKKDGTCLIGKNGVISLEDFLLNVSLIWVQLNLNLELFQEPLQE